MNAGVCFGRFVWKRVGIYARKPTTRYCNYGVYGAEEATAKAMRAQYNKRTLGLPTSGTTFRAGVPPALHLAGCTPDRIYEKQLR